MREKELLHYELEMSKNRVNKEIKILQRVVEGLEVSYAKLRYFKTTIENSRYTVISLEMNVFLLSSIKPAV